MGNSRKVKFVLIVLLAVLSLAGYLTLYVVVRRENFQEPFMDYPAYTLLNDEETSHWVFLYAYYPVVWLDRRLFAHATEIVTESRSTSWSNR